MSLSYEKEFLCPYCGRANAISLDSSEGRQFELVTDCEICCRPIVIAVRNVGDEVEVEARAENA